jgi:hypothetical protein
MNNNNIKTPNYPSTPQNSNNNNNFLNARTKTLRSNQHINRNLTTPSNTNTLRSNQHINRNLTTPSNTNTLRSNQHINRNLTTPLKKPSKTPSKTSRLRPHQHSNQNSITWEQLRENKEKLFQNINNEKISRENAVKRCKQYLQKMSEKTGLSVNELLADCNKSEKKIYLRKK